MLNGDEVITLDDLRNHVGPQAYSRGVTYERQGHVSGLRVTAGGAEIVAFVSGTRPQPYRVRITVREHGKRRSLSSSCTCPIGQACKHVAAVGYAVIDTDYELPTKAQRAAAVEESVLQNWLERVAKSAPQSAVSDETGRERVAYLLSAVPGFMHHFPVAIVVLRFTKAGRYAIVRKLTVDALIRSDASVASPQDIAIGHFIQLYERTGIDRTEIADDLLRRIIGTGAAYFERAEGPALSLGQPRAARLAWQREPDGLQRPRVAPDDAPDTILLPNLAWYVDRAQGTAGPIDAGVSRAALRAFLTAPPLEAMQAHMLRTRFAETLASLAIPPPEQVEERVVRVPAVPCLRLRTVTIREKNAYRRSGPEREETFDVAELSFGYAKARVAPFDRVSWIRYGVARNTVFYERDFPAEARAVQRLEQFDLIDDDYSRGKIESSGSCFRFLDDAPQKWSIFAHRGVGELRAEGWHIEIDRSFRHAVVDATIDAAWIPAIVEDERTGWFDIGIGLDVDGKRFELLPVLRDLLRREDFVAHLDAMIAERADAAYYLTLGKRRATYAFPASRLRAIVQTLIELADPDALHGDGTLRVPRTRVEIVSELESGSGLRWDLPDRLRSLADRLRAGRGVEPVAVPRAFTGELRPYQRDGLDWLQFLAAHGLGGILADDMGLGKSVQTLVHLACQKERRRLTRPALLVVPTSLVSNWCDEAARFTPKLRVLPLHGPARAERFAEIADHDLVITTYALLPRDAVLGERAWHAVIFDEAQAMKNPQSKAAQVAMTLQAEHRLCLTGTPVENHLGDLWSLFTIVVPGLLGERTQFNRIFRTPIEKHQDIERRRLLAARVAPFMLRRTKEAVAPELPEKTEIVQRIELQGSQRDLYETVRLAMHERVQREIEERGLARSQIVILDALLKLRQVCCDPRLLPPKLRRAAESAKLEHVLEMLPQLIEEGRRVLVFSQFTSMLALIEPELARRSIPYALLTGETQNRAAVVKRFQSGEVPVFLISLKAGGVGLNLTAADTVIHFDPWWNPAVERQATDRAHRIGQSAHVFVYKLIGAGTVEERIVELQARKAELAAAIFTDDGATGARFTHDDVERLFAPLSSFAHASTGSA